MAKSFFYKYRKNYNETKAQIYWQGIQVFELLDLMSLNHYLPL